MRRFCGHHPGILGTPACTGKLHFGAAANLPVSNCQLAPHPPRWLIPVGMELSVIGRPSRHHKFMKARALECFSSP
jgi:hypothetical protein